MLFIVRVSFSKTMIVCCMKPASISGALPLVRLPSGTTRCSRGLASSDATALIGPVLHVPPLPPRTATLGSARFVSFNFCVLPPPPSALPGLIYLTCYSPISKCHCME